MEKQRRWWGRTMRRGWKQIDLLSQQRWFDGRTCKSSLAINFFNSVATGQILPESCSTWWLCLANKWNNLLNQHHGQWELLDLVAKEFERCWNLIPSFFRYVIRSKPEPNNSPDCGLSQIFLSDWPYWFLMALPLWPNGWKCQHNGLGWRYLS